MRLGSQSRRVCSDSGWSSPQTLSRFAIPNPSNARVGQPVHPPEVMTITDASVKKQ